MTDDRLQPFTDDQNLAATAPEDEVDVALGTEARIMLKAIRLPETDPIPEPLKRQVRETLKAHLRTYRINYSAVAIQIGAKSDSVIGEVLNAKYRADDSPFIRKLNSWIDDDERRRRRGEPIGLYETSVLMSIRDAAVIAKKNARTREDRRGGEERARIVMAVGPSGIGKSDGAKALAASDPNAILIRIVQRGGSDLGLAKAIIQAAGWRGIPARTSNVSFVLDRLKHSGRLLIGDEAHRLSPSGYEFLRDLADVCGIPILLLGTSKMQRKVDAPRTGVGNYLDEQFSRRVCYVVDLLRGSDGQGGTKRPFFSIEEIAAIFKSDHVKLTGDGAEVLQAIACQIFGGMLGLAANIYEIAYATARKRGGMIDGALVRKAARKVLMPPGNIVPELLQQIENQIARNRSLEGGAARRSVAG